MRDSCATWLLLTLCAIVFPAVRAAHAAEFRTGQDVTIKSDEVIQDDLYCFGEKITIDGTVEGDVVAFGGQITVNGQVKGDVMAAGQTVVIMGQAEGARIAGQVLKLGEKAKLDGDLLGAGLSLECTKDSEIDGDAVFAGYQALFGGRIANDVKGALASCQFAGTVAGDVKLEVGNDKKAPPASTFGPPPPVAMPNVPGGLSLSETAVIEGDLTYTAPQEAERHANAKVEGEVKYDKPKPQERPAGGNAKQRPESKIFGRVRHIVSVLLVGVVALVVMPSWTEAWTERIRQRPGATLVSGILGFLAFIAILVVAVVVIIAGAVLVGMATLGELVPMVLVGGVVGYAALIVGFWIVAAFLAEALTGMALGRIALRDSGFGTRFIALLIGVVVLGLIISIPWIGSIVGWCVLFLALGSICLWLVERTPPQSFAVLPPAKPIPSPTM
jgi:cytoskeletal protein CcmA (bactofilin family)